jgi:hypothetical protein
MASASTGCTGLRVPLKAVAAGAEACYAALMSADRFERHRQPWTPDEVQKLHTLAKKGMALKAIAKALKRSEESTKDRAKADGLSIAKLR